MRAHQVVARRRIGDGAGVERQHPAGVAAIAGLAVERERDAELAQQRGERRDVGDVRQVAQAQRLAGQ